MNVARKLQDFTPVLQAAIVLIALRVLRSLKLPCSAVAEVVTALGVSESRAYELATDLEVVLPELARGPGRPRKEREAPSSDPVKEIAYLVRDFLMANPGAVVAGGERRRYSDQFRQFIVGLFEPGSHAEEMPLEQKAMAAGVPTDTLKDWLRAPTTVTAEPASSSHIGGSELPAGVLEQIVHLWRQWQGDLNGFCDALRRQHRINISLHSLRQLLELTGERSPRRRKKPNPFPEAIRDSLERFFPGAQIVSDGKQVVVELGTDRFVFTWELAVDADTGAHTGFAVRDAEDSDGLLEALEHHEQTTGAPPEALLRDNLPANHAPNVEEVLADKGVISMPSTIGRPENKASCEGAFGLFSQRMPPIVLPQQRRRELARAILWYIFFAYCAGRNHVPRARLANRSAAEAYEEAIPTDEERVAARERLLEIKQRILDQRKIDQQRTDQVCRQLVEEAFRELSLSDPEGHFVTAVARCGYNAALEAISILKAKLNNGRLDTDFPERYLLGIAANVARRDEDLAVYRHLLDLRTRAGDLLVAPLVKTNAWLERTLSLKQYIDATVTNAVNSDATLDRRFWLRAALTALEGAPHSERVRLCPWVAKRIAVAYSMPAHERDAAIAELARLSTKLAV